MAGLTERHRHAIQSASLVFVCTLIVVVVATALFESTTSVPGTTSSSGIVTTGTGDRVLGSGPISTFPASWDDLCESLVSGNETTGGTNFGPGSPLGPNLTLGQAYSDIVSSSVFQSLAAGRSWVTLDWGTGQEGPIDGMDGMQTFLSADFLFISEGIPDPDGYAQMTYFIESDNVTGFVWAPMTSCAASVDFRYGARLSTSTLNYAAGQPIGINFTFTNLTNASITITAMTSCLANFTVLQGGAPGTVGFPTYGAAVYHSAKHPGCAGPPLNVVLSPGKGYAQTIEWNQTDDNGTQVPPGYYWITGIEAGYLGQTFPVSVIEGPLMIGNQTQG